MQQSGTLRRMQQSGTVRSMQQWATWHATVWHMHCVACSNVAHALQRMQQCGTCTTSHATMRHTAPHAVMWHTVTCSNMTHCVACSNVTHCVSCSNVAHCVEYINVAHFVACSNVAHWKYAMGWCVWPEKTLSLLGGINRLVYVDILHGKGFHMSAINNHFNNNVISLSFQLPIRIMDSNDFQF